MTEPWPVSPIQGQIALDWPRSFEVEALAVDGPPGAPVYEFWPRSTENHATVGFVVYPQAGEPWVGRFGRGRMQARLGSILTNGPHQDWVTVAVGGTAYLVDTTDPSRWQRLPVDPVMDVRASVDLGIVVVADFVALSAFGLNGLLWETERLAYDGLRIDSVDATGIRGVGWNAPDDRLLPLAVDPKTGSASAKAFP